MYFSSLPERIDCLYVWEIIEAGGFGLNAILQEAVQSKLRPHSVQVLRVRQHCLCALPRRHCCFTLCKEDAVCDT